MKTVCVIGLGTVGLPTAMYIKNRKLTVYGYDVSSEAVTRALEHGVPAFRMWGQIPEVDVYVLCVSTWNMHGEPDLKPIFQVCQHIAGKSRNGCLVSIESTVTPGTSRQIYDSIFAENVKLVHVPHRFWHADPVKHGVQQPRVLGAINLESMRVGRIFYKDCLKIPIVEVSAIESAEMCKIAENAYRYVQIAFAEELKMICTSVSVDFKEVRRACNSKWNIQLLDAIDGIGGNCLPKDTRHLKELSVHNTLLTAAQMANQEYCKWVKTC